MKIHFRILSVVLLLVATGLWMRRQDENPLSRSNRLTQGQKKALSSLKSALEKRALSAATQASLTQKETHLPSEDSKAAPQKAARRISQPVFTRVAMTPELWKIQKEHFSPSLRAFAEQLGRDEKVPATALVSSDDEVITAPDEIKPLEDCPALKEANYSLSISINETGEVQDVSNLDAEDNDPIPSGIYDCKFTPYITPDGEAHAAVTTIVPDNELNLVLASIDQ